MMYSEHPKRIEFYHHARRYLREHDPLGYETMRREQIEHLADALRLEEFRRQVEPYQKIKLRLVCDFYGLQVSPCTPMPGWLHERLTELDTMIAAVGRAMGFELSENGNDRD